MLDGTWFQSPYIAHFHHCITIASKQQYDIHTWSSTTVYVAKKTAETILSIPNQQTICWANWVQLPIRYSLIATVPSIKTLQYSNKLYMSAVTQQWIWNFRTGVTEFLNIWELGSLVAMCNCLIKLSYHIRQLQISLQNCEAKTAYDGSYQSVLQLDF